MTNNVTFANAFRFTIHILTKFVIATLFGFLIMLFFYHKVLNNVI